MFIPFFLGPTGRHACVLPDATLSSSRKAKITKNMQWCAIVIFFSGANQFKENHLRNLLQSKKS